MTFSSTHCALRTALLYDGALSLIVVYGVYHTKYKFA